MYKRGLKIGDVNRFRDFICTYLVGKNSSATRYLQVDKASYLKYSLTIPTEVIHDLFESLVELLGVEALASILFHVGRRWGYRCYLELKKENSYTDEEQRNYIHNLLESIFEDFRVDAGSRKGKAIVKVLGGKNLTYPFGRIPLIAYVVKGFIQTFLGCLLGSDVKVRSGKYLKVEEKMSLFEITFKF